MLEAEHDEEAALVAYARARVLAPGLASLVVEQLTLMLTRGRPEDVLLTLDGLPTALVGYPQVRLLEVQAAVALGDTARAGAVLESGLVVPQIREGAGLLANLWYDYRALVLAATHELTREEAAARARREQLPAVYDFSMTAVS
jgi:hypothetical protein